MLLRATSLDRQVADTIKRHTTPQLEKAAQFVSLLGDEHLLLAVATGIWFLSRCTDGASRNKADHMLATVVASAAVPHLMKHFLHQERPDRDEVALVRHGIPRSGKKYHAFPSGHAVHMGAVAGAISNVEPNFALPAWLFATVISLSRVVLLAHWLTDVVAGGMLGVGIERVLRLTSLRAPEGR